jgi:hypothetical protein
MLRLLCHLSRQLVGVKITATHHHPSSNLALCHSWSLLNSTHTGSSACNLGQIAQPHSTQNAHIDLPCFHAQSAVYISTLRWQRMQLYANHYIAQLTGVLHVYRVCCGSSQACAISDRLLSGQAAQSQPLPV